MKFFSLITRIVGTAVLLLAANAALALNPNHKCTFCHNLHNGAVIPTAVETLCLSCHGAAGLSVLKAAVHTNKTRSNYPAFRISCMGCHNPHSDSQNWMGGTNRKLVGRKLDATGLTKIQTPNSGVRDVVFESRGTTVGEPALHSFADSDADRNGYYDGICETCHTQTGHHRNNAADPSHNAGKTCTASCHPHTRGFLR